MMVDQAAERNIPLITPGMEQNQPEFLLQPDFSVTVMAMTLFHMIKRRGPPGYLVPPRHQHFSEIAGAQQPAFASIYRKRLTHGNQPHMQVCLLMVIQETGQNDLVPALSSKTDFLYPKKN